MINRLKLLIEKCFGKKQEYKLIDTFGCKETRSTKAANWF